MSNEEFEEKVKEVENNIKVIEAYDKIYDQMKQVDKILEKKEGSK